MNARERSTIAAAVAVLLACAALIPLFDGLSWALRVAGAVLIVSAASAGARSAGLPRALQPLAGLLGLAAYATVVFAGSTLSYGLLPTGATLTLLGDTVRAGLVDVEELAPPVPGNPGLVLLAVLGVGLVAIAVDTLAVVLRQAAAAGLPLLTLFVVPSAVLPDGLGALPFVAGAAGWLGLLLADSSDTVSRWGAPLPHRRNPSDPSLGRVGRRIGLAALGVAVVVPALVPGLDSRLLGGGGGDGFGGGSRNVTTYNPITRLAGQLNLPEPRELLRYTTDDATPDYLRMTTLDVFDADTGWSSSALSGDPDDDRAQDGIPRPDGLTSPTRLTSTQIRLSGQLDGPWLPTPIRTDDVDVRGPWLWDAEAETVFSTRTSLRDLEDPYTVTAARPEPSVALLRSPQSVPDDIAKTYAQRPDLSPYVLGQIDQAVAGQDTAYDRVVALQAFFREDPRFSYDEEATAPGINSPNALDNFLQGGRGFCEQYSSAMAAMVRGLGLPARVAVGFTPGTRQGKEYVVTTSEAHAWPEVWFQGAGWIRFEPTPRSDDQASTPGYSTPPIEQTPDPATSAAPSTAPSTAPILPDGPAAAADRGGSSAGPIAGDAGSGGPPAWLLLVPLTLLALAGPRLLSLLRTRRRWRTPGALTAWAQLQDDAVDVGHRWRGADSPRAAAAHLQAQRSLPEPATAALLRLAGSVERARYGRPGVRDDTVVLRRDADTVRAALLAGADRRTRLLALLAPVSTLRWASRSVGTAMADTLDRFDTLTSRAGARLRHPRSTRRA